MAWHAMHAVKAVFWAGNAARAGESYAMRLRCDASCVCGGGCTEGLTYLVGLYNIQQCDVRVSAIKCGSAVHSVCCQSFKLLEPEPAGFTNTIQYWVCMNMSVRVVCMGVLAIWDGIHTRQSYRHHC